MRTRAWRRHTDVKKALRKRSKAHDWYDNLHQYSKNKIHCSCPMCRTKIKNKQICGPAEEWPMQAKRRFVDMDQQEHETISDWEP